MAISDNKITNAEIAEVHVQAAPDTLTGSAQQNKAVFDAYSDLIKEKHNSLIDDIEGEYASNWRNGSQTGSVRTTGAEGESGAYTIGKYAVTEGQYTQASGVAAHAEGRNTIASGSYAHAEGNAMVASGYASHAEGAVTIASGDYAHAEGQSTQASGSYAHAEGRGTKASGDYAHAEGGYTKASGQYQHVSGKYNIEDANNVYAEIVGNGTDNSYRSNARTLDWEGNEVLAGKLTVGTEPENNKDVATKGYVDTGLAGKVDKVTGKGLSTEDYTTSEKAKLSNIEAGAEVNVQADWETNDTNSDAYINNKPYIPNKTSDLANDSNYATEAYVENGLDGKVDKETGKGLSANDYTSEEKAKLEDIEAGAEVNVQSDWSQNNSSADDYIKNKPTLPSKTSDLTNDSDYTTKEYVDGKLPIGKASGSIASVKDGADGMPMKSLVANIVPQQSGTGTPSPENIRPISGWTEVETSVCGKNLFDSKPYSGVGYNLASGTDVNLTESSIAITQNDNGFSYEIASNWQMVNFKTAPLKAGTYHVQVGGSEAVSRTSVYVVGVDGKTKDVAYNATGATIINTNKTLLDGEYILVASGRTTVGTQTLITPQIELGTTATAYEPCTATTHTTSLGRTVYGGEVDVVSGTLTVTHAIVDLGSLNWTYYIYYGNNGGYSDDLANIIKVTPVTTVANASSSRLRIVSDTIFDLQNSGYDLSINPYGRIKVSYVNVTTSEELKTAMSGVQLCYELAEPQTYQLTPQTINTLSGVNNVWAESGDCSIEYVRDIGLALDNLLPDSPTTDGTYTLVCTVSDGKATIAWQSSGASLSSPLSMSSPASLNSQINTTEGE